MSISQRAVPAVPRSPRLLAAVLVFLAVQSTAVASLGTPLLPTVQRVEQVSLAASQWTLTITLLAGAVATPLMGRLGDGRLRRLTTVGAVAVMLAGCVLSALPAGFPAFLAGRALQGAGLGLVPLATAVARDDLPADRSRPAIVLIGVTTAAGIGIGYPLVGLLAQALGLYAPFWFAAGLSALALAAALVALPDSPARPARVDVTGAVLLGAGNRRAASGAGPGSGLGLDVGRHARRGGRLGDAAGRLGRLGAARSASADRTAAARPPAGTGRQPHRLPDRRRLLPAAVAGRPLRPDAARGRLRPRRPGGRGRGPAHPVLPG